MKTKTIIFSFLFCLLTGIQGLNAQEADIQAQREEDLRTILQHTFLRDDSLYAFTSIIVEEKFEGRSSSESVDLIFKSVLEEIQKEDVIADLMNAYESFSDEEIHEMRVILENTTYLKFIDQTLSIMECNIEVLKKICDKVIEDGLGSMRKPKLRKPIRVFKDVIEWNSSKDILTITNDNYHEEVELSKLPVIIDVYMDWCNPCRMYSKTFEEISDEYGDKIQFGKIHAQDEKVLMSILKPKAYPTTFFIYKGKVIFKETGYLSKFELRSKIESFLKKVQE